MTVREPGVCGLLAAALLVGALVLAMLALSAEAVGWTLLGAVIALAGWVSLRHAALVEDEDERS